jgi:hypothetical protein
MKLLSFLIGLKTKYWKQMLVILPILIIIPIIFIYLGGDNDTIEQKHFTAEEEAQKKPVPSLMEKIVESRQEKMIEQSQKSANILLNTISDDGERLVLEIEIENPEQENLIAFRSFLAYDPKTLFGDKIEFVEGSPFDLGAPGEKTFDTANGLVKIGASSTKGTNNQSITVARITFKRIQEGMSIVDFYDVKKGGHTTLLKKNEENPLDPQDILRAPDSPALLLYPKL